MNQNRHGPRLFMANTLYKAEHKVCSANRPNVFQKRLQHSSKPPYPL